MRQLKPLRTLSDSRLTLIGLKLTLARCEYRVQCKTVHLFCKLHLHTNGLKTASSTPNQ